LWPSERGIVLTEGGGEAAQEKDGGRKKRERREGIRIAERKEGPFTGIPWGSGKYV